MQAKNAVLTAEKKVKGRKRHIVVDTQGCILSVEVHAANIHDTKGGITAAIRAVDKYPSIEKFCGDDGYRGTFVDYAAMDFQQEADISSRIKPVFEILPKRWIVERTLAWLGNSRRLSKDYEISTDSAENMVLISNMHTLLKRRF